MFKKLLATLLVLMMTLTLLGTALANEGVSGTVNFVCAYAANYGMQDLIDAFQAKFPNVTVNLNVIGNNEESNLKIDTMLMGDGEIDVLLNYTTDRMETRSRAGRFVDLTDLLAEAGLSDMKANWGCDVRFTEDKLYYGVPVDGLGWYIAINMTEWENAGLGELPTAWTWDEYTEACRKMTHDDIYGGFDVTDVNQSWALHVRQVEGADVYYDENGMSSVLSNPLWRKAIEMKYQNEVVDKIWFPYTEGRPNGILNHNAFLTKKVASTVCCNIFRFIADTEQYPIDFKVGFAPYPTDEPGQPCLVEGPSPYGFLAITKDCKDNRDFDAAWEFVKFFATDGNYYLMKSGHISTYSRADKDEIISYIFGGMENAEKLIDIDSFKRFVLNFEGNTYVDTILGAGGGDYLPSYQIAILSGEMSIDDGLAELEAVTNQGIIEAAE